MSHRSGLFRNGLDSDFWEMTQPFPSKEGLIQEELNSKLIFTPNECTKYSNMGFALLSLVIENVMDMPFQQAMEPLVFKKLPGTHFLVDYDDKKKDQFATGYSSPLWEGKRRSFNKHVPALAFSPATGFCGNAEDTSLFFDTFLRGEGLISRKIQQETLSRNWPVPNESDERYGLGLTFQKPEIGLVGHDGGYFGYKTYTGY